ncbi:MAG TPA: hypothetical protein VFT67_02400 [Jatrophihabitantaceae bacterium]|nr:hypothetical protein [Jatrophihabitantaceae bacterium]
MTETISTRRDRAGMVRIARDCWLPAQSAQDLLARCAAVVESAPTQTVIAYTTAAELHGLWLPNPAETIHIATYGRQGTGREMTWSRRPELTSHRLQLRTEDVTFVDGVPVTSMARTWRDLGTLFRLPDLVAAGDSALRAGATRAQIQDVLTDCVRGRGIRLCRQAFAMLDERSASRPESHLRVAITAPGIPRFAVNESVFRDEGGWLGQPDLSLAEAKIALEYQGEYHAGLMRMRRDLTRDSDFRSEGWRTLLYGPAEVFRRPWQIRSEVRREVAARAPHLLVPASRVGS